MHIEEMGTRENLSDEIAVAVRTMILDGEIPEQARINEVHLSLQLGVSRTPLREGLRQLTSDGSLEARPRKGFFVRALTLDEFGQLYSIRPILDPEALRLSGIPSRSTIQTLIKLNEKMARAKTPDKTIEIDDIWHLELLAHCPNRVLIELIENLMLRTKRYELALMRETANVKVAVADHSKILRALDQGDIESACAALRYNMESGRAPIVIG